MKAQSKQIRGWGRWPLASVLIGALALPLSASAADPVKGGTLTVGLETDVRGFDTVKGGVLGVSGRTVSGAIHEPLVFGR